MTVKCLEQIQKGAVTFRTGETYFAEEVNEHWYAVDSIGFETEEFGLHFEEIEDTLTEEDASERLEQESHQARMVSWAEPEIPIVPGLWDNEEENEEEEKSFFETLKEYVF